MAIPIQPSNVAPKNANQSTELWDIWNMPKCTGTYGHHSRKVIMPEGVKHGLQKRNLTKLLLTAVKMRTFRITIPFWREKSTPSTPSTLMEGISTPWGTSLSPNLKVAIGSNPTTPGVGFGSSSATLAVECHHHSSKTLLHDSCSHLSHLRPSDSQVNKWNGHHEWHAAPCFCAQTKGCGNSAGEEAVLMITFVLRQRIFPQLIFCRATASKNEFLPKEKPIYFKHCQQPAFLLAPRNCHTVHSC